MSTWNVWNGEGREHKYRGGWEEEDEGGGEQGRWRGGKEECEKGKGGSVEFELVEPAVWGLITCLHRSVTGPSCVRIM